MPTYNYHCSECDSHFSYFQKMTEAPISKCENCTGFLRRVITGGTGLIFKGSGFYLTDYKDEKKSNESKEESSPKVNKNEISKSKISDSGKKITEKKENKK